MKKIWLGTSTGIWFVAIGLVTVVFSLCVFTFQDIWILFTGKLMKPDLFRTIWYLLSAGFAAIFSAFTAFLWRHLIPRITIGLFSVAMASQILERLVAIPLHDIKLIAACRVVISLAVVLIYLDYQRTSRGPSMKSS